MASVLIVDDDRPFAELTKRRLEKADYSVTINTEPSHVIPLIASGKFKLVMLDLSMPDLNGENLLAVLRNLPALDGTRVLVYSSADEGRLKRVAEKFNTGYVSKSASSEELLEEVRKELAGLESPPDDEPFSG